MLGTLLPEIPVSFYFQLSETAVFTQLKMGLHCGSKVLTGICGSVDNGCGTLVENGEDICRKDLFWLPGRYQQGGCSHSYICLLRSA